MYDDDDEYIYLWTMDFLLPSNEYSPFCNLYITARSLRACAHGKNQEWTNLDLDC